MVAASAKRQLTRFGAAFDRVVFAIPSFNKHSAANLEAFRGVLLH